MDNPSENFRVLSTLIHILQGAVFFIMGLAAVYIQEKGAKAGEKIKFISPLAFIVAGALSFALIINILGHGSFNGAVAVMKIKPGFFIFVALACVFLSAGFSGVLFEADRKKNGVWGFAYLIFIFAIVVLYAIMHTRVSAQAEISVMTQHIAMAATLAAALIFKIAGIFKEKRFFNIACIVFLFITSFQLIAYKENEKSFKRAMVTVKAEIAPPNSVKKNNGKTTDKKRLID